ETADSIVFWMTPQAAACGPGSSTTTPSLVKPLSSASGPVCAGAVEGAAACPPPPVGEVPPVGPVPAAWMPAGLAPAFRAVAAVSDEPTAAAVAAATSAGPAGS